MKQYKWELEKYSGPKSRFRCPNCGKSRQYTRYVDSGGNYAPYEYGKCNRTDKCGYFRYPSDVSTSASTFIHKPKTVEYIDWNRYNFDLDFNSSFIKSLLERYGEAEVFEVMKKYYIRTVGDWMVFPYVDNFNRLTYVKKMLYNGLNRSKGNYDIKALYYASDKGCLRQCLFGLHLYSEDKPVHIVESEKTALICALEHPDRIWMATGGSQMTNKIEVLDSAIIYPDKGKAFKDWYDRLNTDKYRFSDFLERLDLPEGADLADYILSKHGSETSKPSQP